MRLETSVTLARARELVEGLEAAIASLPDDIDRERPFAEHERVLAPSFALADRLASPTMRATIRCRLAEHLQEDFEQAALFQYDLGLRELSGRGNTGAEPGFAGPRRLAGKRFAGRGGAGPMSLCWARPDDLVAMLVSKGARQRMAIALLVGSGNLYLRQRQHDPAKERYGDAARLVAEIDDAWARPRVLTNQVWLALAVDDREAAQQRLAELRALTPGETIDRTLRTAWLAEAAQCSQADEHARAAALLDTAVGLFQEAGDAAGKKIALTRLGAALVELGRVDPADKALRQAESIDGGDPKLGVHIALGLARCARLQEQSDALPAYLEFTRRLLGAATRWTTDEGRLSVYAEFSDGSDEVVELALRRADGGDPPRVLDALEVVRWRSFNPLLTDRRSRLPRPPGQLEVERIAAGPVDLIEAVQSSEGAGFALHYGRNPAPDLDAPAATLHNVDATATVVQFFVTETRTAVVVRSPGGSPHLKALALSATVLRDRVEALREHIAAYGRGQQDAEPWRDAAHRLYERLLGPVEAHLPEPGSPLVLVPHGPLWRLPFAALLDGDERPLLSRFVLSLLPSVAHGQWLAARPRPDRAGRVLVVADPGPGSAMVDGRPVSWGSLRGARQEAERIVARVSETRVDTLVGTQADELRLVAWHGGYTVLHFATHGFVPQYDALDSFLALGDAPTTLWDRKDPEPPGQGSLRRTDDPRLPITLTGEPDPTAPDVHCRRELDARTIIDEFHLHADLVVLSACDTGLGTVSPDGVLGLSRAWMVAGARSVVASLWPIRDRAAADFMDAFYAQYVEHGDKARALQHAATMLAQTADVTSWGSFILVGLPR